MNPATLGLRLTRALVVLDVETTGVNPDIDRVVELALNRIAPDGTAISSVWRFNPGIRIPAEASAVHGITDADVASAPPFGHFVADIAAFLVDADLLAYNGSFDRKFVKAEFARCGRPDPLAGARLVDPFRIFCQRHPRDLAAAVKIFLGEDLVGAHEAYADVKATARVLEAQLAAFPDLPRTVDALAEACSPRDPSWVDAEGKLVWRDGEACLNFGKFQGVPLRHVRRTEESFLRWMLAKDFPADTKQIVTDALRGIYPQRSPVPAPAVEEGAF